MLLTLTVLFVIIFKNGGYNNMKSKIKIFEKTYSILLLLLLSIFVVNLKIYASENFEIVNYEGMDFLHFLSTNFFVEKNLYDKDPTAMTPKILSKKYEKAKKLIYDRTGLKYDCNSKTAKCKNAKKRLPVLKNYEDYLVCLKSRNYNLKYVNYDYDCDSKIYIVSDEKDSFTSGNAGVFVSGDNAIKILKKYFFKTEYIAHEMVHSIIFNTLGEAKIFGGFDEAIAGQTASEFAPIDPDSNEPLDCFPDRGAPVSSLGQHMIKDWKKQQRGIISKWLEKVKKGSNQIEAFLDLGGHDIAKKYGCGIDLLVRRNLYREIEPFAGNKTRSIIRDFINKNGQNVTDKIVDLSTINKEYRDVFIELGGNEIAKEYGCEVKTSNRYLTLAKNVCEATLASVLLYPFFIPYYICRLFGGCQ